MPATTIDQVIGQRSLSRVAIIGRIAAASVRPRATRLRGWWLGIVGARIVAAASGTRSSAAACSSISACLLAAST